MEFVKLAKALAGLAVLAGLTGCATPLQQCLVAANQDVLNIQRDLDAGRNAVRYGYRIERVMMPELVTTVCPAPGGATQPCTRWVQEIREIRHPVNRELERERVALLEQQLARAEQRAGQGEAQCRATYPEE